MATLQYSDDEMGALYVGASGEQLVEVDVVVGGGGYDGSGRGTGTGSTCRNGRYGRVYKERLQYLITGGLHIWNVKR